jgi:two-component system LytT family response regulator
MNRLVLVVMLLPSLSAAQQTCANGIRIDGRSRPGEEPKSYASRFLVKDGEKEILLASEKIDWIEAADYYCCLRVGSRSYMMRESIADLTGKLNPRYFVRIHRSSIVNLVRIREIYSDGQTEGSVVLTSGRQLRMSKGGRQKLMELGRT